MRILSIKTEGFALNPSKNGRTAHNHPFQQKVLPCAVRPLFQESCFHTPSLPLFRHFSLTALRSLPPSTLILVDLEDKTQNPGQHLWALDNDNFHENNHPFQSKVLSHHFAPFCLAQWLKAVPIFPIAASTRSQRHLPQKGQTARIQKAAAPESRRKAALSQRGRQYIHKIVSPSTPRFSPLPLSFHFSGGTGIPIAGAASSSLAILIFHKLLHSQYTPKEKIV